MNALLQPCFYFSTPRVYKLERAIRLKDYADQLRPDESIYVHRFLGERALFPGQLAQACDCASLLLCLMPRFRRCTYSQLSDVQDVGYVP